MKNQSEWWKLFYDKNWLGLYPSLFHPQETTKEIDKILKIAKIKKSDRILDLCCGYGRHSIELAKRGYQVTGFDYSKYFLSKAKKEAQKEGLEINFIQGDIRELPFKKDFDVVLMLFSAAFYFSDIENKNIFIKLNKVVKPGGKIIIAIANAELFFEEYLKKGFSAKDPNIYRLEDDLKIENTSIHRFRTINLITQEEKVRFKFPNQKKQGIKDLFFHHYTSEQITNILAAAGFMTKKIIKDFYKSFPNVLDQRIILIAEKTDFPKEDYKITSKIILDVQEIREKRWSIPPVENLSLLLAQAKSKNDYIRKNGLELLNKNWLVKFENSIENAKTVDLLEEFEQFNPKERKQILKNIYAIELINGCTGGCYFCVSGTKNRIEKKYSFDSLQKFYEKYKNFLPHRREWLEEIKWKLIKKFPKQCRDLHLKPPQEREILLYWDGDPFCYQDEEKTLIDVYNLMVNHGKGKFSRWISTSIPPGSQKNFVLFFEKIATDFEQKRIKLPIIRISLAKHNVQRVETTLLFLYFYLLSKGIPEEKIKQIYDTSFICHIRDEKTLFNAGSLVNQADKIRDIISPQCRDGIILSPGDSRIQLMLATNYFLPMGSLVVPLEKNDLVKKYISNCSNFNSLYNYAYLIDTPNIYLYDPNAHLKHLQKLILQKKIFLRLPFKKNLLFFKNDKKENLIFILSRNSLALRHFLEYSSQLSLFNCSNDLKNEYFKIASQDFEKIRPHIINYLSQAKKQRNNLKINYYIFLMEFYLNHLDLLMKFIVDKRDPNLIIAIANFLLKIGESAKPFLKSIFKSLSNLLIIDDYQHELIFSLILVLKNVEAPQIICLGQIIKKIEQLFSFNYAKKIISEFPQSSSFDNNFLWLFDKTTEITLKEIGPYWQIKKEEEMTDWLKGLRDLLFAYITKFSG